MRFTLFKKIKTQPTVFPYYNSTITLMINHYIYQWRV